MTALRRVLQLLGEWRKRQHFEVELFLVLLVAATVLSKLTGLV